MLRDFAQDLKYATRALLRRRTLAATAVVTIALAIAVATTVFSVVNALILHPFPFANGSRTYTIAKRFSSGELSALLTSDVVVNWQNHTRSFEQIGMMVDGTGGILAEPGRAVVASGTAVSSRLFEALGVRPLIGRDFMPSDTAAGAPRVMLLGEAFWEREYGGSHDVVGRQVELNDTAYSVIGVMPQDVESLRQYANVDLWLPVTSLRRATLAQSSEFVEAVGVLTGTATTGQAQKELAVLERNATPERVLRLLPRRPPPELVRPGALADAKFVDGLWLLFGATLLVVIIGAANVANLQLVSYATRGNELSVRAALGATRGRIVRQLLVESLMLAVLGGCLGLLLSSLAIQAIVVFRPSSLEQLSVVRFGGSVLLFGVCLTAVAGLACAIGPSWYAAGALLDGLFHGGGKNGRRTAGQRIQSILVVAQIAVSVVLLLAGGLLVHSLSEMLAVDPGYKPSGLLEMSVQLPPDRYADSTSRSAYWNTLVERARSVPDVQQVTPANGSMLGGQSYFTSGELEVDAGPNAVAPVRATYVDRKVSSEYFRTLGITMLAGIGFSPEDYRGETQSVIVDQSIAKLLWPGQNAVGKRFRPSYPSDAPWATVKGVIPNIGLIGLSNALAMQVYEPVRMDRLTRVSGLLIRLRPGANESAALHALRGAIHSVDPGVPITLATTESTLLYRVLGVPRFTTTLLAIFAMLATVLAGVGLYGVVAQSVGERTHEIGIRVALGATRVDVMRWVLMGGGWLYLAGVGLGLAAATAGKGAIAGLLYGVSPFDPLILLAVPVMVLVVALLATYAPARRAARVDPVQALRAE